MIKCPKCGAKNHDNAISCWKCGLSRNLNNNNQQATKRKRPIWIYLMVTCFVFVITGWLNTPSEPVDVDKSNLHSYIEMIDGLDTTKYSTESAKNLFDAYSNAMHVYQDDYADLNEVQKAEEDIDIAIKNLEIPRKIVDTYSSPTTFGEHYSVEVEFENSDITIENAKEEITRIVHRYQKKNTIIWVYGSTSSINTIMDNWITYAIYVPNELSSYNNWYEPSEADENGIYWIDNLRMKEIEESNAEHFDTAENVLLACVDVMSEAVDIYNLLKSESTDQTTDSLLKSVEKNKDALIATYKKAIELDYCDNEDINQIVDHCIDATGYFINLIDLLEYKEDNLAYFINNAMNGCHEELKQAQNKCKPFDSTP